MQLLIDGNVVIDALVDQAPTTYTYNTTLSAGYHELKVKYYENSGGAMVRLTW